MKYIKQFTIILLFTCVGELLNYLIPLPIPAGIYGMVLMLITLLAKIIKPESIREVGNFLLAIMPLLFVEPAVSGLLNNWNDFRPILFPGILITVISTFSVMIVAGMVAQLIIKSKKKKENSYE